MNKQQAINSLIQKITPICTDKGAYMAHDHNYVIVGYRRFRFDNKRYCKKMQREIDHVIDFVNAFIPLISGYTVRNPIGIDEARQLKAFLDLNGLKAETVGFKLFINGVLVDKTLNVSSMIKGA